MEQDRTRNGAAAAGSPRGPAWRRRAVKTTKTLGPLGTAALASALLAACSTGSGTTTTTASAGGGAGGSSNANCPLVGAPDPGNSAPPSGVANATGAPKMTKKSTYTVAFSQNASNNPWRLAETASFKSEAQKRGWKLTVTDANNDQAKQIQDIKGLIAQKPDALFIAPITEQLGNVVVDAAKAGVPVFLVDRAVDMKVAVSQDGDFTRDKGRQVTETLLQSHPEANAIYAHNDEMAIGAIAALKSAGKTPGKDVKLVSIDGEKDGVSAIQKGELYTSVECSPRFGPKAFDTMQQYASGQQTPVALINTDRLFNS